MMRSRPNLCLLSAGLILAGVGCESTSNSSGISQSSKQRHTSGSVRFTADNNPTTNDGRGEPNLDDFARPAAWVFVDNQAGSFQEVDGRPQAQWVMLAPVSSTPTFRVEVLDSLLGGARDFACTLSLFDPNGPTDGPAYAMRAEPGTFRTGLPYSLLNPGSNFVIRNVNTGDVVSQIAPLDPGHYLLAVKIKNSQKGSEGLALTTFTVE